MSVPADAPLSRARRAAGALALAVGWAMVVLGPAARADPSLDVAEALAEDVDYAAGKKAAAQKDWGEATKRWSKAVVRFPDNADLHNDLGHAYRNLKDLDRAFVHYKRALSLDPRHRGAHEYIGEAYLMAGDLASAEQHVAALRTICLLPCEELADLEEAVGKYRAAKGPPTGRTTSAR